MLTRSRLLIGVLTLALALAVLAFTRRAAPEPWTVTAQFVDTTGVYVGNDVQYLGVPVGTITAITPRGTHMDVEMSVSGDIRVPREARAEILQSALLTDRYVELGPVFRGGAALASGATIPVARTRSPISFDDLGTAIDKLVVALDSEGADGRDIGDLIHVTARNLDGNGARIRRLIVASRDALAGLNAKEPDLRVVSRNLDILARTLGARDAEIRRFTANASTASRIVAGQTADLSATLGALTELTTEVTDFIGTNRSDLLADLDAVGKVTATIRSQQTSLAHVFDYLPTGAENIARAYDARTRSLRVVMALRNTLFFNQILFQQMCTAVAGPLCSAFTNPEATGLLDQLLGTVKSTIPGGP